MLNLFEKKEAPAGIRQSAFICRRDGLTIRGTEYRPEGENLPIAVVCHGFMAYADTVRQYAIALAQMGYAAYCFDFCGGSVAMGKSDGKTTDMSVLTEVEDLKAVIAFAKAQPYTGDAGLTLMGCSQGGFVCALTGAVEQTGAQRLILFFPALCIPDNAREGRMLKAKFDPANVPETFFCGPMRLGRRYPMDVMDMDAFEAIAGFEGDVLIVHGTADRIVDIAYSERALEVYRRTARSAQLVRMDGAGHVFSRAQDAEAIAHIRAFAAKT